jgi:bifunctional non-homologous end joining protein LigD
MTTPAEQHISLFYTEGSSDKEYHVHLVQKDSGWVVNFEYGRRGSALRSGTKTKDPIDFETAKKTYDKVVHGQLKDGYTESNTGTVYQSPELSKRFTNILPQLLNPLPEDDLETALTDTDLVAQEKFDGERRLIHKTVDKMDGINRDGLAVPLAMPLVAALTAIPAESFVFDGELIGERIAAFDLLELNGVSLKSKPFLDRHHALTTLLAQAPSEHWIPTPVARTAKEKRALFERVKAENGEGVVFKKKDSPYAPGRPASGGTQQKFKFIDSATVYVTQTHPTKRSVFIAARDAQGVEIALGKVTIPSNAAIPDVGAIVEVQYLYAYPHGSLFQPVYKGVRNDQTLAACVTSQLKYKKEDFAPVSKQLAKP